MKGEDINKDDYGLSTGKVWKALSDLSFVLLENLIETGCAGGAYG